MTDPVMQLIAGELLTVEQAAEALGCRRTRLFALLRTGELDSTKHGRRRLISAASIERYIEATATDLRRRANAS